MADHFVDRGAHALRVAVVVERTRVGAGFDGEIVHEHVDVVGRDSRFHEFASLAKNVGGESAGRAHPFDDLGRFHAGFVPARHLTGVGVGRAADVGRNRAHGGDDPGHDATFHALVTALVLTA